MSSFSGLETCCTNQSQLRRLRQRSDNAQDIWYTDSIAQALLWILTFNGFENGVDVTVPRLDISGNSREVRVRFRPADGHSGVV